MPDNIKSTYDKMLEDPSQALELSAAGLQLEFYALLTQKAEQHFEDGSSSPEALAEALGVPVERVLSVLDGTSENRRESSSLILYARYLRALDYEVSIELKSVEQGHKFTS